MNYIPASARSVIDEMRTLGLTLPAAVSEALSDAEQAGKAARSLVFTPEPLAPDVLLKADAAKRIAAYAAAKQVAEQAQNVAQQLAGAFTKRVGSTVAAETPTMLDDLETWFADHLDELCAEGGEGLHPARAEHLTAQRRAFEQLHAALLGGWGRARNAGAMFDSAPWFMYFTWTREQRTRLVDATGPGYELRYYQGQHNLYGVARALGAQPSLVRDWASLPLRARSLDEDYTPDPTDVSRAKSMREGLRQMHPNR